MFSVCFARCPWQSTEQSCRCSARNGACWSHGCVRGWVRGGHWSDAVEIGSSEELRWTVTVVFTSLCSVQKGQGIQVQGLQYWATSVLHIKLIISHNQLGLTLCYGINVFKKVFFIEWLVYSVRMMAVLLFVFYYQGIPLGKSLLSKVKQKV